MPAVVGLTRAPAIATTPRRGGTLLGAAYPGDTTTRWESGVYTWGEAVPGWRLAADCDPTTLDYGLDEDNLPAGAQPFLIQTKTTGPRTRDLDELTERARMQLDAVTSTAIGRELWTGELTAETGGWNTGAGVPFTLSNPRPASSGTASNGPWLNPHLRAADMLDPEADPAAAVGSVESAAQRRTAGPVFIHIPTELMLSLSQFGIVPEGDTLRTALGSYVIADPGYPGTTADDNTAVYATGPVQIWLGDPVIHNQPDHIVELGTNRIAVWAERPALALFDPQTLVGCAITT